jgi:ubiquinone/menaquinone biosynthesis C-methylase UbiE
MFPSFYNRKYNKPYARQEGKFVCEDKVAEIVAGIPRFASEASYASLFGDQWKAYKKTQLDSYTGVLLSENRINRCLGPLKDNLKGKVVLEAGCGAGRFTEVLLKHGATVVSSDLSSAVEVNQENFPQNDNHMVIQADINDMPFEDGVFDVVVCLGVIQHTPSSEETIKNLYRLVKSGGSLVIDHYTFSKSNLFRLAPLYRIGLRKKTASETIPITQRMVKKYLPLYKKYRHNKIVTLILNRLTPLVTYYNTLPQLSDQHQEEWAFLDTHDSLTDWYKNIRSKKQIVTTLTSLGAVDVWCEHGGNGVEARCKKP